MVYCSLIYLGMREKHRCSHEAEFEVQSYKTLKKKVCCGRHVLLTLLDLGGPCLVKPLPRELPERCVTSARWRREGDA